MFWNVNISWFVGIGIKMLMLEYGKYDMLFDNMFFIDMNLWK